MKNNIILASLSAVLLLCSCSQTTASKQPESNEQEAVGTDVVEALENSNTDTKPSDIVEGSYTAQAVMYDNQVVAFKDNKEIADLYDTNWVVVYNDGTFGIQNGIYWNTGNWDRIKIDNFDNSFLFAQKESAKGSESSHAAASSNEKTYIGYLSNGDINTLILVEKDYKEGDLVLVYVRNGTESVYLSDSSETASSSSSQSSSSDSSSSHSSSGSSSSHSSSSGSSSSTTRGQRNAVSMAKDYLEVMAFSHDGLVEQLEYEGFSHSDAVYGADHCGADWYEQAERKAREYLDTMSFSYSGLYDQLIYEGFTAEQAQYGVDAAY